MTVYAYAEDTSRLLPGECPESLRLIYEPLDDLITDSSLTPLTWGDRRVSFHPGWDVQFMHKRQETGHKWQPGDVVESGGSRWNLLSGECVYRQGQWAMCWLSKRETT